MRSRTTSLAIAAFLAAIVCAPVPALCQSRPIDAEHSTVTVLVYKSGLFSAFADNHVIRAPIASGSLSDAAPLAIELTIRTADMRVVDPGVDAGRRDEIQQRMLGPEVLDVTRFADITFASTNIEPAGNGRWQVTGRLTIHGQAKSVAFPVSYANGKYSGEVTIKQRDFGIEPIKVAGGTVKVKDEMRVQFAIVK
jgi:polyisoprenoid-binding protein YceI